MQGGAYIDQGAQDLPEREVILSVVQVPAPTVVVRQAGVGRRSSQQLIERFRSQYRLRLVDDGEPVVEHLVAESQILGTDRAFDDDASATANLFELRGARRRLINQPDG